MAAPQAILDLVARFTDHRDAYLSSGYNEAQLRQEFLDPMFEALGWDMANRQGYAEAYKEVIHEDAIKIGSLTKAPDYSFRVGGVRKFFLEAKKPARNLKDDPEPAYQLRRYAWSAKLPLSVLTDFEEFAVYDCRIRPASADKASVGRTLYLKYTDYATRWEEIAGIFSRDAVLKGSFDKYAESGRKKRGTAEVDVAFLADIERWRELLAKNFAARNDRLEQQELNFAVQRTIDRIIFLRIAEDRGLETYGQLQALSNGAQSYGRLRDLFRAADARYNSGLFHFRAGKDRHEAPDELTLGLKLDDKPLKEIIAGLYYPESPYEFSVLSADILGQVYEQFLGKVIRLTAGHQAKVEEKPEVKKAGGVYYTPTYIVDYIVRQTVGKLLEGKTPKEADKLTVLDPACGSGSFLIGAYQHILDWYRDQYALAPDKHRKQLFQGPGGAWRLTSAERKRILLNNIYGVDIDPQAVEVTKLSLLLKVLEGENAEALQHELNVFRQRALPDLGDNIKCGNSLIGPEIFEGQLDLADRQQAKQPVNAFEWAAEFPTILRGARGGFSAVIGNPPYVLLQLLDDAAIFAFFSRTYEAARYKIDTYHLFLERGLLLTKASGLLGFIVPNTFLRNKHAVALREFILKNARVRYLRLFLYPVFPKASVDTAIAILERGVSEEENPRTTIEKCESQEARTSSTISEDLFRAHPKREFLSTGSPEEEALKAKLCKAGPRLGEFATAYFGIQTHDRTKFVSTRHKGPSFKPTIDGGDIHAFRVPLATEYVDFRPTAIKSGGKRAVYEQDRIGVRQIGAFPTGAIVPRDQFTLNTIYNIIPTGREKLDLYFLLGIINSRAIRWFWQVSFSDQKRTFPKIKKDDLLQIPLPSSPTGSGALAQVTREISAIARDICLFVQKQERTRSAVSQYPQQRELNVLLALLNRRIYASYHLTPAEIRLIEEATA